MKASSVTVYDSDDYRHLLSEIREVLQALNRCASRVKWSARRGVSTIPDIGLDFDVIYPLFGVGTPELENTSHTSLRLYRDILSRAAVMRFIEDPMAQNVFLPGGTVNEIMRFLEQYSAQRSLDGPLLSALQRVRGPHDRFLVERDPTPAVELSNLGLLAGELTKYESARPIAVVLDLLQMKMGTSAPARGGLNRRNSAYHYALDQLERVRPRGHLANHADAGNLGETTDLLLGIGSRPSRSNPPVLVSSSRVVHMVGKRLGEVLRRDLDGYPLVGDSVDLILTHAIVQRSSPDEALTTLAQLRETLVSTEAAVAELSRSRPTVEGMFRDPEFHLSAFSESLERFRELWRSINSKTLLDGAGIEIAFAAQLVDLGAPTREGRLVIAVSVVWDEILRELERNPRVLFEFSKAPEKFEELVAGAYKRHGWDHVELTPRSGDRGRDVIATKVGFGAVRFLDQVKAYSPGHLVTHGEVRAMIGVLALDQNASKALITTTSDFAPGVLNSSEFRGLMPNRLELKNGDQLRAWLLEAHLGNRI